MGSGRYNRDTTASAHATSRTRNAKDGRCWGCMNSPNKQQAT
ncbi:TPA: hypothetical protein ACUUEO_000679 [Pseudomonas aeruginosa]